MTEQAHAQAVAVGPGEQELYPPHPPREDTPEYRHTHDLMVNQQDTPCRICGVRKSTLGDPVQNPFRAKDLESHHYPIQRELIDAVDFAKAAVDFPQITDRASLIAFVDSPENMWIICDVHHRGETTGIHHLPVADWIIQRYLFDGYVVVAGAKDEAADLAKDQQIVDADAPEGERA